LEKHSAALNNLGGPSAQAGNFSDKAWNVLSRGCNEILVRMRGARQFDIVGIAASLDKV